MSVHTNYTIARAYTAPASIQRNSAKRKDPGMNPNFLAAYNTFKQMETINNPSTKDSLKRRATKVSSSSIGEVTPQGTSTKENVSIMVSKAKGRIPLPNRKPPSRPTKIQKQKPAAPTRVPPARPDAANSQLEATENNESAPIVLHVATNKSPPPRMPSMPPRPLSKNNSRPIIHRPQPDPNIQIFDGNEPSLDYQPSIKEKFVDGVKKAIGGSPKKKYENTKKHIASDLN